MRKKRFIAKTKKETKKLSQKNRMEHKGPSVDNDENTTPDIVRTPLENIHPNPAVGESMKVFENGEKLPDVGKCVVCQEIRPIYHASFNNPDTNVKLQPWKLNKKFLQSL